MSDAREFDNWLDQFTSLTENEVSRLPLWSQPIAFIHRFACHAAWDGAGSLFYNDPDYPSDVVHVAAAFEAIGEADLSQKIIAIQGILAPFAQSTDFTEQCLSGVATRAIQELDELLSERWTAFYAKLEDRAHANGWTP